ncbi:MAG: Glucose-1-phosphate adenylyltransferase [Candidatus Omnitrophica bacterium]|nr:Glucose-1-phosphate adenylyltransferase [Candidatus Omnitrophota bacterium]
MALKSRRGIEARAVLEPVLVDGSRRILEVIQIIDRSTAKIALVVDSDGRLRGTITDGDIRRAILRGVALTEPAERIMNGSPRTASTGEDRPVILERMKDKQIHQMPVLDAAGRVVRIELLDELIKPPSRDNIVVLMAGGLGTRLKPLTEERPKPLLNIGKKPILETILDNFIEYGFRRFYLSVNYKNEMVREHFGDGSKWGVEIRYLHEDKPLGTAGALSLLPEKPRVPVFVMNGDLLTKVNFDQLLHFHQDNAAEATMCVREYDLQVPYGVVRIDGHRVRGIDEKPVHRFFVNAGIYVLGPGVLRQIRKGQRLDMPHLFDRLVAAKREVAAFPIREYWLDIGRLDDLERAKGEFAETFGADA